MLVRQDHLNRKLLDACYARLRCLVASCVAFLRLVGVRGWCLSAGFLPVAIKEKGIGILSQEKINGKGSLLGWNRHTLQDGEQ